MKYSLLFAASMLTSSAFAGGSSGSTGAGKTLLLLQTGIAEYSAELDRSTNLIRVDSESFIDLQSAPEIAILTPEGKTFKMNAVDQETSISVFSESENISVLIVPKAEDK